MALATRRRPSPRSCLAGLALLAALWPAESPAAEPAACGGRDLLAAMKAAEPERHRAVLAAAEATENGRSVFWRIDPPGGGKPSWLFGTAHLSDPRVIDLPKPAARALAGARVVALENTSILDMNAARSAYGESIRHMIYTDGRTLPAVIGASNWEKLRAALTARGLPAWSVMSWKPWMVTFGALIYPPCELARWIGGRDMLDITIGKTAKKAGKPVLDLESTNDQFSAIDAMSEADQIAMLTAVLSLEPISTDMQETMVVAYEASRIDLLWAHSIEQLARGAAREGGAPGFVGSVMANAAFRRNLKMMDRALPLVREGNAFLAVGALHLVGEKGLVRLFREAGFTVTAVQ